MLWFVARRLLHAVPLLFAVVILNFVLIATTPGDPVTILVGDFPAPPGYVEQIKAEFGLDQPIPVQLVRYVGHVLTGDLGYSFANRQPVTTLILGRLAATLELTLTALVLASILGILVGVLAARWRGTWLDLGVQGTASAGYSVPDFWAGQLLILVFAVWLGWLPSQGNMSVRGAPPGFAGFLDHLRYLLLPALALSFRYFALITRVTRAAMLEVLGADFILAVRSRGVAEGAVMIRHALRNAAAPVVTVIGYNLGYILAGSALIESVFGWPGIGRLLYDSISRRDYPVMLGILLMVSATVVIANLLADILQRLIDPRVAGSD